MGLTDTKDRNSSPRDTDGYFAMLNVTGHNDDETTRDRCTKQDGKPATTPTLRGQHCGRSEEEPVTEDLEHQLLQHTAMRRAAQDGLIGSSPGTSAGAPSSSAPCPETMPCSQAPTAHAPELITHISLSHWERRNCGDTLCGRGWGNTGPLHHWACQQHHLLEGGWQCLAKPPVH